MLAVFLPIVLTNIVFYVVTTNNVKEQKMKDISIALEQIRNDFLESVYDAVSVSSMIYTDNNINELLDKTYDSPIEYVREYDSILRGFNKYGAMFSSVASISFYTDNDTIIYSGGVNRLTRPMKQTDWYKNLDEIKNYPVITRTGSDLQRDTFSVIRELDYYQSYNRTNKIMKIDLKKETVSHIFSNVTFQGNVYLINEKGEIEYTTDPTINWAEQPQAFKSLSLPEGATVIDEAVDSQDYFKEWRIVGVFSEEELLQDVYHSREFILYLASLNILVPTLVIVLISRSLHRRINRLLHHMKKMKNQSFETINGTEYQDEIGQLTSEFNRMSTKIRDLIQDVYVANIQKKDLELQRKQAQLSALQSQINPHFLFNALETIRMRSLIKEEKETAKIIQNMAKMLRRSFTWGRDWVTVEDEMNIVLSFLEIQKYRFEDKLEYCLDIDESAKKIVIPNMILLPFVENASIHGIEHKKGKGTISISAKKLNDWFEFVIQDNGPGFDPEKLEMLLQSLRTEDAMGDRVGIKNVYYRLKLHYVDQFSFDVKSDDTGTKVTIRLPIQE